MMHRWASRSGLLGIAVWFGLELYRQLIRDALFLGGQGVPPDVLDVVQPLLLAGTVLVLASTYALSEADEGARRLLRFAIGVQWLVPGLFAVDAVLGGTSIFAFFGLLVLVLGVLVPAGTIVAKSGFSPPIE